MKKEPLSIYRSESILGNTETELSESLYYRWGQILSQLLLSRDRFFVCSDHRLHSDKFKSALIEGLLSQGISVVDIGKVPSILSAYAMFRFQASGSACVSGWSHPTSMNGLSWGIVNHPMSRKEQLQFVRKEIERYPDAAAPTDAGTYQAYDVTGDWIDWHHEIWYDTPKKPLRILLDPLNGIWSGFARRGLQLTFSHMIFEAIHDEPDPLYCGLVPNARNRQSIRELCNEVDIRRADMGVALDDSGNITLVDDYGVPLSSEEVTWLLLRHFGKSLDGEIILHDINCSEIILDKIRKWGGKPEWAMRDSSSFIHDMIRKNALLGLGKEGKIYFRAVNGFQISYFLVCLAIDFIARLEIPLSQWRKTIPRFFVSPELRVPEVPMEQVLSLLEKKWATQPVETVDGFRFVGPHGRVHIRTFPAFGEIGFHIEASNLLMLNQMIGECCSALGDLENTGKILYEKFRTESPELLSNV